MIRLSVVFILLLGVLIPLRSRLVPGDFGVLGHYRASALVEIAARDIKYAGHQICFECHDDIVALKGKGYHRTVNCETCHGPAAAHVEAPLEEKLRFPRERGFCPLCHGYLASRPTGFPQIVPATHNPLKACITCHNPHDPVPSEVPQECGACHAAIARTKAVSHHVYVPCTRCHDAPEAHRISPRRFLPTKPMDRAFCGQCHSRKAEADEGIVRVDMETHGERYVCWQCHYPHLPET